MVYGCIQPYSGYGMVVVVAGGGGVGGGNT